MKPAKTLLLLTQFTLVILAIQAQTEFHINNNGLIYADSTISQLKHIVDSLNLKFKVCDLNRKYHAVEQTAADYIRLAGRDARQAKKDMDNGMSFDELVKKYPKSTVFKYLLVTRDKYVSKNTAWVDYCILPLGDQPEQTIKIKDHGPVKWAYNYEKDGDYTEESVEALYFNKPFLSTALPLHYARLVQYADCLVDTTATIYTSAAYRDYRDGKEEKELPFLKYLLRHTGPPPAYPGNDHWDEYEAACTKWQHQKDLIINKLSRTDSFQALLSSSLKVALEHGGSNEEFESYVEHYISPAAALALKRGRIVVGGCSQDMRPREHAFDIARLSASSVQWEIFLRAHLDIMNDRFERASDGSYALAGRETYIHELEVLDINVPDLIAGISLRVADASSQHYYGNISRVGRALAEATDRERITKSILRMIADPQLDLYNRTILFYLFLHYTVNLQIERERNENVVRLRQTVQALPQHMINHAMQTIVKFTERHK